MEIKSYPFGELAQMYYPDHNYQSALQLFRREMEKGLFAVVNKFIK